MRAEFARPWLMLALFAALTVFVYWPALDGGFLFDDRNLVESPDLHVDYLALGRLDQGRAFASRDQPVSRAEHAELCHQLLFHRPRIRSGSRLPMSASTCSMACCCSCCCANSATCGS